MTEKFKPCPFCGGQPDLIDDGPPGENGPYAVACEVCGCATDTSDDEEHALRIWNQRAENMDELVAALKLWHSICTDRTHSIKFEDAARAAQAYLATFNALQNAGCDLKA